jgi:hypothetical protein
MGLGEEPDDDPSPRVPDQRVRASDTGPPQQFLQVVRRPGKRARHLHRGATGVSVGGSVYRIVPGRSYLQTRAKRATPEKTAGDDTTGGSVCVSVQGSDESWIPDSRMTAGLPLPLHRRYSLRLFPMAIRPAKFRRAGVAFAWLAVVAWAGVPAAKAARAAGIAMTMPLAIRRPRTIAIESLLPVPPRTPFFLVVPHDRPQGRLYGSNRRDDPKAGELPRATLRPDRSSSRMATGQPDLESGHTRLRLPKILVVVLTRLCFACEVDEIQSWHWYRLASAPAAWWNSRRDTGHCR